MLRGLGLLLTHNIQHLDKGDVDIDDIPDSLVEPEFRAASRYGSDSMSPTVPPISTITTSAPSCEMVRRRSLISSVMCGIIWTHFPRKSPRLSRSMTEE